VTPQALRDAAAGEQPIRALIAWITAISGKLNSMVHARP
jgi:hypothetical protein